MSSERLKRVGPLIQSHVAAKDLAGAVTLVVRKGKPASAPPAVIASGEVRLGQGGSRYRGITRPTGVNNDPNRQPDTRLRVFNMQPSTPGPREEVYCTKVGSTRPYEMYIVAAHMDGQGWGEAAN